MTDTDTDTDTRREALWHNYKLKCAAAEALADLVAKYHAQGEPAPPIVFGTWAEACSERSDAFDLWYEYTGES